jgi:putative tryptophan/tyrosine transport system substrate-binding protein
LKTGVVLNLTAEGYVRRRDFIKVVAGSMTAWPLAVRAQQPAMPVVGFLSARSREDSADLLAAVRSGLGEHGFVEDHNVRIESRWANDQYDRLEPLARELVAHRVAAILTSGVAAALAAKAATSAIPIVFLIGFDPVQFGLVSSLNRPTGNVTGLAVLTNTLEPRQLQLLHEVVPATKMVGFLANPTNPGVESDTRVVQSAASTTQQQILVVNASSDGEIDTAFEALRQQHAETLLVMADPFLNSRPNKIVGLAARYAIPAMYPLREFPMAGGLMSYGTNLADGWRQIGIYGGKILKGAEPADLPVQQSVKVEFVINLKTANALGLTVPHGLLIAADEVIE